MKEVKYTQTKFVSRDGESFDCKEDCKRHEQHLDWLEINKKKFGEDFEFSALKNEKFNYFYHSKLGIIKDIT